MVHCQQKKVKHMVEEVRTSKTIGTLSRELCSVQFPYATLLTNAMEDELNIWDW